MAGRTARESAPVPRFGSRADWPRYIAGMLAEVAYILVLSTVAIALAIIATVVAR